MKMRSCFPFGLLPLAHVAATGRAPAVPPHNPSTDQLASLEAGVAVERSSSRPIFGAQGREVLLREAHASIRSESPHAEWYSRGGERLLGQILSRLPADDAADKSKGKEAPDAEALWMLCRSSMGIIEASLQELGQAQLRVERLRRQWQQISSGSPSLAANYALHGQFVKLRSKLRPNATGLFKSPAEASLGSGRTRVGLGIRRRALLRSEQALACHAGALHDLRVLLRDVGGEWLELGRWVGGPPLSTMPWDAGMCPEQQKELLLACARVVAQMRITADALQAHGPYALYSAPFPAGAKDVRPAPLAQTRSGLVAATREMLSSLVEIRSASRQTRPILKGLAPPGLLQRKSLVWACLLCLLSYAWTHWWPILWPMRFEALAAGTHLADDLNRFFEVHVREPLKGIARELFHGYEPTIDPAQVRATRESLVRMLQDFVRDAHAAGSFGGADGEGGGGIGTEGGDPSLEEALEQAAVGNMAQVTLAYEEQARAPLTNLMNGKLLRSLLLIMQQLRLLMEEEVEAVDSLLKRNDFNLQVMATVPAFTVLAVLLLGLRQTWRRMRTNAAHRRDPIEAIQAEVIAIDSLLTRAEGDHTIRTGMRPPAFQRGALSQFEVSPMALSEVGELVFRVQRLRELGGQWLRGLLRAELMHDAQVLLDSGRLSAEQRARVARSLMRRLDNINFVKDHW